MVRTSNMKLKQSDEQLKKLMQQMEQLQQRIERAQEMRDDIIVEAAKNAFPEIENGEIECELEEFFEDMRRDALAWREQNAKSDKTEKKASESGTPLSTLFE